MCEFTNGKWPGMRLRGDWREWPSAIMKFFLIRGGQRLPSADLSAFLQRSYSLLSVSVCLISSHNFVSCFVGRFPRHDGTALHHAVVYDVKCLFSQNWGGQTNNQHRRDEVSLHN